MKNYFIFSSLLSLTLTYSVMAEDIHRDPAMEHYGPTVIQETALEPVDKTYNVEFTYIGDIGRNFSGGNRVGNAYAGLGALRGSVDLERAVGLKGASAFAHLQGMHGNVPSLVTGDAQITSNIESYTNTIRFMEAWIKQTFYDDNFHVIFGLMDINAEFYLTESSLFFVNSSFGLGTEMAQLGPDGRTASTFPVTSLAALLKYHPSKEFYIDTAIFDAMPGEMDSTGTNIKVDPENEGYMLISEAGWTPEDSKLSLGMWTYTRPYDHIYDVDSNGDAKTGRNYGTYVMGEHHFSDTFTGFIRYGVASESVNRFKDNLALGVAATGLIAGRELDKLGLGLTQVTNSNAYRNSIKRDQGESEQAETVVELTYKYRVSNHLSLQPDFQYVIDPGTNPEFTNALMGFLRVQIDVE